MQSTFLYIKPTYVAYICNDTHCRTLKFLQISLPSFTPLPLFHLSSYGSLGKWSNLYITLHTFPDPPKQNLTITDKDVQKLRKPTPWTSEQADQLPRRTGLTGSGFTPTRARQPDKRRKETQTTRLPTWKVESAATKILTPKSRRKLIAPKMLHQAPRKAENDHKKYNSADPETHFPHATKIYPAATM